MPVGKGSSTPTTVERKSGWENELMETSPILSGYKTLKAQQYVVSVSNSALHMGTVFPITLHINGILCGVCLRQ